MLKTLKDGVESAAQVGDAKVCGIDRAFREFRMILFSNENQAWTFYAQLARLAAGLVIIGLLTRSFSSELLATWYIFVSIFGMTTIVELGMSQVIGRHTAYLRADHNAGKISSSDFYGFVKSTERIYLFLAIAIGGIAFPIGLFWIEAEGNTQFSEPLTVLAWALYVIGGSLGLIAAQSSAVVNGAGQMWRTQRIAIQSAAINVAILVSLAVLPAVLLIPCAAIFITQLVAVFRLRHAVLALDLLRHRPASSDPKFALKALLRVILPDAIKMLIIMVSYQLLTSVFLVILSKFQPRSTIASYGITMQLCSVVISMSMVWSQSNFFEMAAQYQARNLLAVRSIFLASLIRALPIALFGLGGIYFIGPEVLRLAGSKTELLPAVVLSVLLLTVWFEFALSQFSQLLISSGVMWVAYLSLFSSIVVGISTFFLLLQGYGLVPVFLIRIATFSVFIGIPVVGFCFNLLRPASEPRE